MSTAVTGSDRRDDLRYPLGRYQAPASIGAEERAVWCEQIAGLPSLLKDTVKGLNEAQLDTPYRPDGWTVRQVVHHLADSHINSYVRFRLALTEDAPLIKTYDEATWAKLEDAAHAPVQASLELLQALHSRWVMLLRSLGDPEFGRTVQHPEWGAIRIDWMLGLYAWHGQHHVAQIRRLREREAW